MDTVTVYNDDVEINLIELNWIIYDNYIHMFLLLVAIEVVTSKVIPGHVTLYSVPQLEYPNTNAMT